MSDIIREGKAITGVVADSTLADSTEINVRNFVSMVVQIPAGATLTTLTLYHAPTSGGTYLPLYRRNTLAAQAVVITSVAASMALVFDQDIIAGCQYLKLVADADTTVTVCLKS